MSEERMTYRFGPVERRGILGQLRAGQAAVVAAGACVAIVPRDREPTPAGGFLGVIGFGASLALAVAPVARPTPEEWGPIALSFAFRRLVGRSTFRSRAPIQGTHADERSSLWHRRLRHPVSHPSVKGVRILEVPYQDRAIGVFSESRRRRLTAVLACRVIAFSLLDPEGQARRLARWGLILSGA